MITVHKYELELDSQDIAHVLLAEDAELLHVDLQYNKLVLWAMVDTEMMNQEVRRITLKGTGHEINPELVLEHINSFMSHNGTIVLHAFEVLS